VKRAVLIAVAGFLAVGSVKAVDPRQRSDSSSRQFTIYCEDVALRQRVASFAEEVKSDLAQLLAEDRDGTRWRTPIIITLERATTLQRETPPVVVRPVQSAFGFRIEINVRIGEDPAAVHLQKQIVRALLLGYSYGTGGLGRGDHFVEAPWWVVEGALQIFRRRDLGVDSGLFKRLVSTGQLPPIEDFLVEKPAELGPAALAMDSSCAMALVELLLEQPGGRDSLARLLREWPHGNREPVTALTSAFPALITGQTIQRWWTLSLARLAASDRHEGLTLEETNRELTAQIRLTVTTSKSGERRTFRLEDYREFIKLPASREVLRARQTALVALSARANALFRPVIAEYEQIVMLLSRGKSRGVDQRLAKAESYRQEVLRRLAQIEDYMNWFEATQLGIRSDAFDSYLKTAAEIAEQENRASDQITRYLDQLEREL
jgi:hypothetical protein